MRNRIYLGATYYYFWSVPFFVSASPVSAYVFAGLLGVLATAVTFEIGRRLEGAVVGLGASLVFATMPLAVIDGRIAWAPAAIPAVCALFLLSILLLLERDSRAAALVATALAVLAVQLHLAAAPLVGVLAIAVLGRAKRLGRGTVVGCAGLGLFLLGPALWAAMVPTPTVEAGQAAVTDGRGIDMLLVGRRAVMGLSPAPDQWPAWVRLWLGTEWAWGGLVALAWVVVALARRERNRSPGLDAVLATGGLAFACVWLLPWEAWHYYLDVALVPAAIVVALFTRRVLGRRGTWLLVALAVGRAAFLFWWIGGVHQSGYVAANLDLLRLGGDRAGQADVRGRVPTVETREQVAETLVAGLGLEPAELWQRTHGPGFSDLDTDNGYFIGRVRQSSGTVAAAEAFVSYRGQVPPEWRGAMPAPLLAGPFEIVRYVPWLDRTRARLVGCGGGPPPARPVPAPLEYGAGELARSRWPCSDPVIEFPVRPASNADRAVVRIFARLDGAGRVVDIGLEPPASARSIRHPALGAGIEFTPQGPARVRIALALQGPASLDVVELRGD